MKTVLKIFSLIFLVAIAYSDRVNADAQAETYYEQMQPVLMEELEGERGRGADGDIISLNNSNLAALLKNNTANNNVNGFNIIDSGSFLGSSGLISVVQNSGNNVIIQDSTIVNVTIAP